MDIDEFFNQWRNNATTFTFRMGEGYGHSVDRIVISTRIHRLILLSAARGSLQRIRKQKGKRWRSLRSQLQRRIRELEVST